VDKKKIFFKITKRCPFEIDYGQHVDNDKMQKLLQSDNLNIYSRLSNSVQDFLKMIFDVETMKQDLLSFATDLTLHIRITFN